MESVNSGVFGLFWVPSTVRLSPLEYRMGSLWDDRTDKGEDACKFLSLAEIIVGLGLSAEGM